MEISKNAKLLRIFIGESGKAGGVPVYEKIVLSAHEKGMAGATVYKGIMGFGGSSRIHTSKLLRLSEDMPLVIEIVDEAEKIERFLPLLDGLLEEGKCGGLITVENAEVYKILNSKF